jgi:mRNA interferase MazF
LAGRGRHYRLELSRGDIVAGAPQGDYGKPRPALVVQSDLFNPTHASVVICPITSQLVDAPLLRLPIQPDLENGLKAESQVMIDKIMAVKRERISKKVGRITEAEIAQVDRALLLWLGIAGSPMGFWQLSISKG